MNRNNITAILESKAKALISGMKDHRYTLVLYLLAFAVNVFQFVLFRFVIGVDFEMNKSNFLLLFGDIFLILAPFWVLSNRWKMSVILPTLFISFFFLLNVWYFNFWGNILPSSALQMTANVNTDLLGCLEGLVGVRDMLFLIPCALIIVYLAFFHKKIIEEKKYTLRVRYILAAVSVIIYVLSQLCVIEITRRWSNNEYHKNTALPTAIADRYRSPNLNSASYYKDNGLPVYFIKLLYEISKSKNIFINLTPEEKTEAATFIEKANDDNCRYVLTDNINKNVILIIVESLNANVVNRRVNGVEVTPTLNTILKEDGTIYTLRLRSQIADGGSGDGQLIYNAGLLPILSAATPLTVIPNTSLVPLSMLLKNRTTAGAVLADDGKWWNEELNFHKYGFADVYTTANYKETVEDRGFDGASFDFALGLISHSKEPFFLEIVTSSMHIPFNDPGIKSNYSIEDDTLTANEMRYLISTAYFDHELGSFIKALKRKKLYDNTIIIIASDHSVNFNNVHQDNSDDKSLPIVFIATNTGISKEITKPAGQIDVYPTILDIAGIQNRDYSGLGTSMLDSTATSFNRLDEIQRVSDLILLGKYFEERNK